MIMTASELRAQAWLERIRHQLSSGMSVRDWCQGNGINEKSSLLCQEFFGLK